MREGAVERAHEDRSGWGTFPLTRRPAKPEGTLRLHPVLFRARVFEVLCAS